MSPEDIRHRDMIEDHARRKWRDREKYALACEQAEDEWDRALTSTAANRKLLDDREDAYSAVYKQREKEELAGNFDGSEECQALVRVAGMANERCIQCVEKSRSKDRKDRWDFLGC